MPRTRRVGNMRRTLICLRFPFAAATFANAFQAFGSSGEATRRSRNPVLVNQLPRQRSIVRETITLGIESIVAYQQLNRRIKARQESDHTRIQRG